MEKTTFNVITDPQLLETLNNMSMETPDRQDPLLLSRIAAGNTLNMEEQNNPESPFTLVTPVNAEPVEKVELDMSGFEQDDARLPIMTRGTTTPAYHGGIYIGQNYGVQGRNLLIQAFRAGVRITTGSESASRYKLYTSTGTFVKSGVWDATSPYGRCIAFKNITANTASFYVEYKGDDGIPCRNQCWDIDRFPIYVSPVSTSIKFNNWIEFINLPQQSVIRKYGDTIPISLPIAR